MISPTLAPTTNFVIPKELDSLIGAHFRFDLEGIGNTGMRLIAGTITDALSVSRHRPREPEEIRVKTDLDHAFGDRILYLTLNLESRLWCLVVSLGTDDSKKRFAGRLYLLKEMQPEPIIGQERVVSILHAAGLPEEHLLQIIGASFVFTRSTGKHEECYGGRVIGLEANETAVRLRVHMPPLLGQFTVNTFCFDRIQKWRIEVPFPEPICLPGTLSIPFLPSS